MTFTDEKLRALAEKYPDLDFSRSVYQGARGKMSAECPLHGTVTKTGGHWNINGCPQCGMERSGKPKNAEAAARKYAGMRKYIQEKNAAVAQAFFAWKEAVGVS